MSLVRRGSMFAGASSKHNSYGAVPPTAAASSGHITVTVVEPAKAVDKPVALPGHLKKGIEADRAELVALQVSLKKVIGANSTAADRKEAHDKIASSQKLDKAGRKALALLYVDAESALKEISENDQNYTTVFGELAGKISACDAVLRDCNKVAAASENPYALIKPVPVKHDAPPVAAAPPVRKVVY